MADETRPLLEERPGEEQSWILRAEEEIAGVDKRWRGFGLLRAKKRVETVKVDHEVPVEAEDIRLDRIPVEDGDSGRIETLPDGRISIPVYEEELVVTKRIVLKERVLIEKHVVTRTVPLREELRTERVELEADEGVEVHTDDPL